MARAMLPGAPARALQENDMVGNVDAVRENHEGVNLDQLQPLQGLIDREDEDMAAIECQEFSFPKRLS